MEIFGTGFGNGFIKKRMERHYKSGEVRECIEMLYAEIPLNRAFFSNGSRRLKRTPSIIMLLKDNIFFHF